MRTCGTYAEVIHAGRTEVASSGQALGEAGEHESMEELIMSTFQSFSVFEFNNLRSINLHALSKVMRL